MRKVRMDLTPGSSQVMAYGYDSGCQRLFVRFRNGEFYCYVGVPEDIVAGLRVAASVNRAGLFLATKVKPAFKVLKPHEHPGIFAETEFVSFQPSTSKPEVAVNADPRWSSW